MRNADEKDPVLDTYLLPGSGLAGQAVTPDDKSLFRPDVTPTADSHGVNTDDVSAEDTELLDPGASPEFDHSLRRRGGQSQ